MLPISFVLSLLPSGPIAEAIESIPTRATVWIRAGDRAVGTGWVIDLEKRWIVTARHVLADRETVEVFFQDRRHASAVVHRDHYLSQRDELRKRGRLVTGKVVAKNDNADLALLTVDFIPADVPRLKLSCKPSSLGETCYSIGHRHDSELLWCRTTGVVRQNGRLSEGYFSAGKKIGVDVPILFLQSPIEAGESGAAVLNQAGDMIGVVSAVANRTPGLAFAIDVSVVRSFLTEKRGKEAGPPPKVAGKNHSDVEAVLRATVWVRPQATEGRAAGVLIDREHRLLLTTATAVATDDIVDIVVPKWDKERLVAETSEYRDLLGLRFSGHCIQGVVLARDLDRDIALIELDRVPDTLVALPVAPGVKIGSRVSAVSHPVGEELMWLCAAGTVRSIGKVALRRDANDKTIKVETCLLQLPHQAGSSGGPVVNERGELMGILATKEGSRQELAYATAPNEIRQFVRNCRQLSKPDSVAECLNRAIYLEQRQRLSQARSNLSRAFNLDWRNIQVWIRLLKIYGMEGGEEARTIIALMNGAADLPSRFDSGSIALIAEGFRICGDRERARRIVDKALEKDPTLASAYLTRADLKPKEEAFADVEKAIALDPNFAAAYALRASLRNSTDPDYNQKTLTDLTRAIELAPYEPSYRAPRAALFMKTKDYKKAINDLTRLTELEPLNAERYSRLAEAEFLSGDRAAAAVHLTSAVRIDRGQIQSTLRTILRLGKALRDDNATDVERLYGLDHLNKNNDSGPDLD